MTEEAVPQQRRKRAIVLLVVAVGVFAAIVAVLAITRTGWFAKTPETYQVRIHVQSSTDFEVIYRYISVGGEQVSVEEFTGRNFTADFESEPGLLQLSVSMPQGFGKGGDLRCSVYVDGELVVSNFGDTGWVNCDLGIGSD